jgi:hypothetical protein
MENTGTPASGDIAGGSSASTASPSVSTDSTQSAAPAIEATPSPITDSTQTSGEPPRERWPDILKNQRESAKAEALKEWREQYGWAESVQRDQLEEMSQWYGGYKGDPAEFLERAYQEALSHPVHGPTVKSRIGKLMASMRAQQQQAEPTFEPDVPVMDANGQIVTRTYSADLVKQMLAHEIEKRLDPYKQDLETRKQRAEREQRQEQVNARADADIAYVKARPGFAKFQKEILAAFQANPKMTIRDAYDAVMDAKLPAEAEAKVLSDLQQKAHAQTVNPGTPSGSAPPTFKKFSEAHAYYEKHPEEAAAMAHRR